MTALAALVAMWRVVVWSVPLWIAFGLVALLLALSMTVLVVALIRDTPHRDDSDA